MQKIVEICFVIVTILLSALACFSQTSSCDPYINQTPPGNIHAALARLSGDRILAYLRPGGNGGVIWRTQSHNLGETWDIPMPTQIPNPNSGIDLLRLNNGNFLLAFNDSHSMRTPLCVAFATNNGQWLYKRTIEAGPGEYSYPSLIQTKDGLIHMVYTYQRKYIEYATFTEDWVCAEFEGRTRWKLSKSKV